MERGILAVVRARLHRRDRLITELAGQLADTREQLGAARERIEWYRAAMDKPALRLVPGDTRRHADPR